MMNIRVVSALILLAAMVVTGCSGGGNPVAAPVDFNLTGQDAVSGINGHTLWGMWNVNIDPAKMEAEITPVRGAEFTANVTRFLQPPISPINLLHLSILPASNPPAGYFELKITVNHPFPGMNYYNGFDVRGILISNGSIALNHDPSALRAGESGTRMLNPDGWTRWWNPTEFTTYGKIFGFTYGNMAPKVDPTSTINPYKYFADALDLSAPLSALNTDGRGFFTSAKGANSRIYKIQFEMSGGKPVFFFQYAIDASWAPPNKSYEPHYPLEAFSLNANMAEPWLVTADDAGSTAYYADPTNYGGELVLNIEVFDWQSIENPGGVPGELSGLWLEGSVFPAVYDVLANATVLPGSTSVSAVFKVTIGNLNLTKSGTESIFVIAESANPNSYKPQLPGGDNFDYPDKKLSSYFSFDVTIGTGTIEDPAAVTSLCPMWGLPGQYVDGIHLEGNNIVDGATVEIVDSAGKIIEGSNVIYINDETLEFNLDLTEAAIGYCVVRVINPSAPPGELIDGFDILDPDNLATWYAVQGNRAHTGMVGLYGPCDIHAGPTWSHNWQPNPYGNPLPIYLNDDTCFISNTGDGGPLPAGAVALPTKSTLWNQQFHDDMQNWLNVKGITEDGSVVLTHESKYTRLVGLNGTDGSYKWQVTGVELRADSFVTLDLNGNFIVPAKDSGYLSINPQTGHVNWNSNTGDMYYSTPAVGANGRIYAYDGEQNNGRIMALDASNGNVIWYSEDIGGARGNGVMVHPNGTIIIPTVPGLRCIQDGGNSASILWTASYECPFYSSTGANLNGDIIFVSWDGYLHKIDPATGIAINSVPLKGDMTPSNRPAIGKDGMIYIRTRNYMGDAGYISCYGPDLSLRWEWKHGTWFGGSGMPSDCSIGQDGSMYSSSRPKGLMCWVDE